MAKKPDELTDHNYDGIQEYDNDLPPWWVFIFYLSIIFGVLYILNYHVLGTGDTQEVEYQKEMARAEIAKAKIEAGLGSVTLAFLTEVGAIESGKKAYEANCIACHGAGGEGGVGPNLADKYWIHGNTVDNMVKVITYGVPEKGMIPWEKSLSKRQIVEVSSYIHQMQGSNPANAKEPQGDLVAE
jgi:cytochrome c oxidase cbb3-type subunit 3